MVKRTNTRRDPSKGRVVGKPGRSTQSDYRQAADAYGRVPIKWVLVGAILVLGVVGAAAHAGGYSPLRAVAATAAMLALVDTAARRPEAFGTGVVIVGASYFAAPFATVYAASAIGDAVDPAAATVTMVALLIVTGMLAHRTSRGRPWVTTLIAAGSVLFISPWLLFLVAPWMGFMWAWATVALVLFLRGGGVSWIVDQWEDLAETVHRVRSRSNENSEVHALGEKSDAEATTGILLADLPAGFTVFHDRYITKGGVLNHLVIGPTGVFLVDSEKFKGRVHEHPRLGLAHRGESLAGLLNRVDNAAASVAASLKVKDVRVSPVVVIHDAVLPASRSLVALSSAEETLGHVSVVTPEALLAEVSSGPQVLTDREVRRVVSRIDRVCPPAARKPGKQPSPLLPVTMTLLGADGHPRSTDPADAPKPMFHTSTSGTVVEPGQRVSVLTDQGSFAGYWVTGKPEAHDGVLYVPLVESDTASSETAPDLWYPLDSVQPEDNNPVF